MSQYVNDLWPGSPRDKESPSTSRSGRSSRLSSASRSRSSSGRSRSRSSGSSRASSRSRSRPRRRSRSRSWSRRRHQRKYRRYSRSYSRSRSRSRGRGSRDRRHGASSRYRRSPLRPRSRSRSGSRGRSYYRRAYALPRGRRYYGFRRTVYPEERRRWRGRSRTRSRSPSPFRLTEKDRMELLEIAKANAAKALGTANFDLPTSLRKVLGSKETNHGTAVRNSGAKFELLEKQAEDGTKNPSEKPSQQKSIAFSSNNSVAKPMLQKSAKATAEETSSGSPKIDKKKSPYGLWVPV
ncbi:arginine/serine-rich protein 1 [Zalophus californianus]|uniref:Arginine/serine-rich protein 1 n=1 Tax=Zalophus californianus TaxID=9704 RepID=A0A6J2BD27_ZALCA|nr:arginine/serine-rich protein 1 [Zalophus californianus]XP_027969753.1 arginine/serine-rich protein 1 [Eumetopias jubatus]